MIQLRDYQQRAVSQLYDGFKKGFDKILWVMPTGAGKTSTSSFFIKACVKKGYDVLIFMHTRDLVYQFSDRLREQFNLSCGYVLSGEEMKRDKKVQIGTVQTLVRRDLSWFKPKVVIIDESHRAKSKSFEKIINQFPQAKLVGLTATPYRADGKPLGEIFETIVHPVKIGELIEKGFLVPTKVYAPKEEVNMDGVKTVAGDFHKGEMKEKFSDGAVVRGVVNRYLELAKGKKAIVFNCDVQHSKETNERFKTAGVVCEHLDGKTPKKQRDKIIDDFRKGKIHVLNSVALFVEGFDVKDTEVVILNVATKSIGRYIQMAGRGLRCFEGKTECIILDFGGNTMRHGFAEDYDLRPFSLMKKVEGKVILPKKCKSCGEGVIRLVAKEKKYKCSVCDYEKAANIREKKKFGEAQEFMLLERETLMVERLLKMPQKRAKEVLPLGQLRVYGVLKGYSPGWWMHSAIDAGLIDCDKNDPEIWKKVNFEFKMAEIEAGTLELCNSLRKQVPRKKKVKTGVYGATI